jgi:hypothetical protein
MNKQPVNVQKVSGSNEVTTDLDFQGVLIGDAARNIILRGATTGNLNEGDNAIIGAGSFLANDTGFYNCGLGGLSLRDNVNGYYNVAVGHGALQANTDGFFNTSVGGDALANNLTGHTSVAVGVDALQMNTTGTLNTAVGANALNKNVTGTANVAIGQGAMAEGNASGSENAAVGYYSLRDLVNGNYNTALGSLSGFIPTSGSQNTFIGASAGNNASQKLDPENSTAIGYGAYTTKSNQVVLGNSTVSETVLRGAVLAGSSLAINGTTNIDGVRSATQTFDFGTVNANDASAICTIPLTGAAVGDTVIVTGDSSSFFPAYCIISAFANTNEVQVRLYNPGATNRVVGSINLRATAISFA